MREEYSDRKLFLGMALRPQNSASPSSATSAMTWLLRSIAHNLSASEARSAWAAGIMREPGSLAPCASASLARRTRSGTNRNNPPVRVVNSRGPSTKSPTLATARALGPIRTGALLVEPTRQGCKTVRGQNLAHRGGAQRGSLVLERLADLVDRIVALTQRHDLLMGAALLGLVAPAWTRGGEELRRVAAAKRMAEHAEGARRVAEPTRDLGRGQPVHVEGAQGLVLALARRRRPGKEASAMR